MPTATRTRSTSTRTAPAQRAEVLFSDDMNAFKRTYRAARASVQGGSNPLNSFVGAPGVAPITMNAAVAFGIEVEFDADYGIFDADSLASELYSAGLTSHPYQQGYHSGGSSVSTSHSGGWRYEEDGSVSGGELVSPKMTDSPETWERLSKALALINAAGGNANSRSAGAHIHMDTTVLGRNVDAWRRLFRMVHIFEDTLFRLAANPFRSRTHRNNGYVHIPSCPSDFDAMDTVSAFNNYYNGHTTMLNMYGVGSNGTGHVEFRIWDASVDESIMQTQVKISVALINAALNPAMDALLDGLEIQSRGFARTAKIAAAVEAGMDDEEARRVAPNAGETGEAWIARTQHIRTFVDVLFPGSVADKEQVITLFAMNNKWAYRTGRR